MSNKSHFIKWYISHQNVAFTIILYFNKKFLGGFFHYVFSYVFGILIFQILGASPQDPDHYLTRVPSYNQTPNTSFFFQSNRVSSFP